MKYKITIFLLQISLGTLVGQSLPKVEYAVKYNFQYIQDTTSGEFSSPEEFVLFKVGQNSRFMSSAENFNDSTRTVFEKKYPEPDFQSQEEVQAYLDFYKKHKNTKSVRTMFKLDKNFKTNNFTLLSKYYYSYYFEEPMNFNWQMTSETDTLHGFFCNKAVTNYGGRTYYAWFTMEIPINDGPYVFSGLPGLIIRVEDSLEWYRFDLKAMNMEAHDRFYKEDFIRKKQPINRKSFVNKHRGFKENPRFAGVIDMPAERLLEMKNRYKKRFDLLMESY